MKSFSRVLRDSTPHFVGPLLGRLVGLSSFHIFGVFEHTAPAQMLWWPSPAPAHPHATRVAMYPALLR